MRRGVLGFIFAVMSFIAWFLDKEMSYVLFLVANIWLATGKDIE